jgi:hypothetical protein
MTERSTQKPDPRVVGIERDKARAWAQRYGIVGAQLDGLLLAVSELVTNAIVHAAGLRQLTLNLSGEFITVAVEQYEMPPPEVPAPGAPGGRGLVIVWALAEEVTTTWTVRLRAWPAGRHSRPESRSVRRRRDR